MVKNDWKWLTAALLIFSLGSCATDFVPGRPETKKFVASGGLPVTIRSPGSVTTKSKEKMNIVVQDILNDPRYPDASKGFRQNEIVKIDTDGDGKTDTEGLVLFNLDIYAYDATDPGYKDPGPDLKKRAEFTPEFHGGNPVVLKFKLSDYRKTIEQQLGKPSASNSGRLGIYYYEPSSGSAGGSWYPIENLVKKGDIRIKKNGDTVEMTILKWPVDDRVHVGN